MKNWVKLTAVALASTAVLGACGKSDTDGKSSGSKDADYTIGATQIVEHPSLDAAYKGFQEAIKDKGLKVKYDFQNAQNDKSNVNTISNNFVSKKVDLIFANSTPSALGALQATKEIPIVFTSVTDAVESGIAKSREDHPDNITGVLDLHPDAIKKTVDFINENFKGATVGLLYNAGEQNSVTQIKQVEKAGKGTDLKFEKRTVSTSAEVSQAAKTLAGKADVIYVVTDNTVVSALDSVVKVANEQKIPLVVGEPESLNKGGFATFGIDYHSIGYRAGEMAVDILKGDKKTKDLPIEYPQDMKLMINKKAAEKQGVKWNKAWDKNAEIVD
ncbi:ABC transporter substrate-binding protein [Aciduricibacillus chroicocephali]|uniref:ABC transporter substrate-binding protein n=1 Tax=Aciduricibacillus chroicocephali TaxID=3054939 RepID=A0ABY9KWH0_9BACI|nr:ABC transporter substrate-binding protein [Bacillaceae bacterium 44XB]